MLYLFLLFSFSKIPTYRIRKFSVSASSERYLPVVDLKFVLLFIVLAMEFAYLHQSHLLYSVLYTVLILYFIQYFWVLGVRGNSCILADISLVGWVTSSVHVRMPPAFLISGQMHQGYILS